MTWTQLEGEKRLYLFVCLLSYCDLIQSDFEFAYIMTCHTGCQRFSRVEFGLNWAVSRNIHKSISVDSEFCKELLNEYTV